MCRLFEDVNQVGRGGGCPNSLTNIFKRAAHVLDEAAYTAAPGDTIGTERLPSCCPRGGRQKRRCRRTCSSAGTGALRAGSTHPSHQAGWRQASYPPHPLDTASSNPSRHSQALTPAGAAAPIAPLTPTASHPRISPPQQAPNPQTTPDSHPHSKLQPLRPPQDLTPAGAAAATA